jgi:hypothetical protein
MTSRNRQIRFELRLVGVVLFCVFTSLPGKLFATQGGWSFVATLPLANNNDGILGMTYHQGYYYAVGGYTNGFIFRSPDGTNWTQVHMESGWRVSSVFGSDGTLVAVGGSLFGGGGLILRSTNGVNWASVTSPSSTELYGVTWGAGKWVAVGPFGTILWSTNGSSWSLASGYGHNYSIVHFNNQFFACGSFGKLSSSADGVSWHPIDLGVAITFRTLGLAGSQLFLLGDAGTIYTTTNGADWTPISSGVSSSLYAFAFNGSSYYAVGPKFIHSTNGTSWTTDQSAASSGAWAVASGAAGVFASGLNRKILARSDTPLLAFTISPSELDFGTTVQLGTNLDLNLTLSNSGPNNINFFTVTVGGPNPQAFATPGSLPSLAPGQSETLTVRFQPLLIGPATAVVEVLASGIVLESRSASMTGTSLAPAWARSARVSGFVSDIAGGSPVEGVLVQLGTGAQTNTAADGSFTVNAPLGLETTMRFSGTQFVTRQASVVPHDSVVTLLPIRLIPLTNAAVELGGYKRMLYDFQSQSPFHTLRWSHVPQLYIDLTPDPLSGEVFSGADIALIQAETPTLVSNLTGGVLVPNNVIQGTEPPASNAIVYKLDASVAAGASGGAASLPDGELSLGLVRFQHPGIALATLRHETGHAIGFAHSNGSQPSLMASASFFWPTRAINTTATATDFDLIVGKILYDRPPGGTTGPDETDATEYDGFGFPLSANDPLNERTEIFVHPPRGGANAHVTFKGRPGETFQIGGSSNLVDWSSLGTQTLDSATGLQENSGSQNDTQYFFRYTVQ